MLSVEELLKKYPCTHTNIYFQMCREIKRAASLNKRATEVNLLNRKDLKPFELEELSSLGYRIIKCSKFLGTDERGKIFSYWYEVSW